MKCEMREWLWDRNIVCPYNEVFKDNGCCDTCPFAAKIADLYRVKGELEEAQKRVYPGPSASVDEHGKIYYREMLGKAEAQRDKLKELVRKMEWRQRTLEPYGWQAHTCPVCYRTKEEGHAADCELAKALEEVWGMDTFLMEGRET